MDIQILKGVRRNLDSFVSEFDDCIKTKPSRKHMRTYVGGQVSALDRKNVEQIALDAGTAPRTLLEFLEFYAWDDEGVRRRVQEILQRDHSDPNAIAIIDETSFAKKGHKTTGVQRQYCGSTGKRDNCVVTVDLVHAAGEFHSLADNDLYLPEKTWSEDRSRCEAAGVPEDVVYRPKWEIAIELLWRSMADGMRWRWLTADEGYGHCSAFRRDVADLGMTYVVEVPCSTRGWVKMPKLIEPEAYSGRGRPTKRTAIAEGEESAIRIDKIWGEDETDWQRYHVKDTEKGPLVWEAKAVRFYPWKNRLPGAEELLIVARNVLSGEVKYFLSNAPLNTSMETLLHVAFNRWRIERSFEDAKGEVGLDHFEVRNYRPLMRHMILSMVSLLFLMKETVRLREKKAGLEPNASTTCCRGAA